MAITIDDLVKKCLNGNVEILNDELKYAAYKRMLIGFYASGEYKFLLKLGIIRDDDNDIDLGKYIYEGDVSGSINSTLSGKRIIYGDVGVLEFFGAGKGNLRDVRIIAGNLTITETNSRQFPSLRYVGGDVLFMNNNGIEDLSQLSYIGGSLSIARCSNLKEIPNLTYIGNGFLSNENMNLSDMSRLSYIGGNIEINRSNKLDIGNLRYIGGDANIGSVSKLPNYGDVEIKGEVTFYDGNRITTP